MVLGISVAGDNPLVPDWSDAWVALACVRNGGHIHFPSLSSLQELGKGACHRASVPRDTYLTVLYATRWHQPRVLASHVAGSSRVQDNSYPHKKTSRSPLSLK